MSVQRSKKEGRRNNEAREAPQLQPDEWIIRANKNRMIRINI
jgi:hypothetical protein